MNGRTNQVHQDTILGALLIGQPPHAGYIGYMSVIS